MKCETVTEYIPLLINSCLEKEKERELLGHLYECSECRNELAFWISVSEQQADFSAEFTEAKKERVLEAIKEKNASVLDVTKQAVKVYFKVIESILNI